MVSWTGFDWVVLGLCLVALLWGLSSGVFSTIFAAAGFLVGSALGLLLFPWLTLKLPADAVVWRAIVLRGGFLLFAIGGAAIGASLGASIGDRIRRPFGRAVNAVLGAVVAVGLVVATTWILISLSTPTSSLVLSSRGSYTADLFQRLPPLPPWIRDLRRVIAESPLPPVVGEAIGADELEPAADDLPFDTAVADRVRANSVMVWANQCGVEVRGSGFVLPGGIVVTNAHVVAGAGEVAVTVDDRDRPADVVAFAANSDLAVLRVPGLEAAGLELGPDVPPDTAVAVAGHPGGQVELDLSPARVDRRTFYDGQNFAGNRVFVQAYVLTSPSTEHGSSGGPVVDAAGRVVGVIFAGDEEADLGLAVSAAELRPILGRDLSRPTAHGACWVS